MEIEHHCADDIQIQNWFRTTRIVCRTTSGARLLDETLSNSQALATGTRFTWISSPGHPQGSGIADSSSGGSRGRLEHGEITGGKAGLMDRRRDGEMEGEIGRGRDGGMQ